MHEGKYGYCEDCMNKDRCSECYRGSWYEKMEKEED